MRVPCTHRVGHEYTVSVPVSAQLEHTRNNYADWSGVSSIYVFFTQSDIRMYVHSIAHTNVCRYIRMHTRSTCCTHPCCIQGCLCHLVPLLPSLQRGLVRFLQSLNGLLLPAQLHQGIGHVQQDLPQQGRGGEGVGRGVCVSAQYILCGSIW